MYHASWRPSLKGPSALPFTDIDFAAVVVVVSAEPDAHGALPSDHALRGTPHCLPGEGHAECHQLLTQDGYIYVDVR